ncbi:MAG: glycosyltransferase family 2 protein [Acidobacteriota bacterium]
MAPKVAAIIVNYNGKQLTLDTLASFAKVRYPQLTLVVVDNGSTDGSHEAVQEAYPDVVALRIEKNAWIAGGLNVGIEWAMAGDFDYLLLLNNDIDVHPRMVREMVRVAERDPKIGCVGPKCYYYEDPGRLWSAGGVIRFAESVTRERGARMIDYGPFDRDEEVDYINGCAMLVRREAMAATGPWDAMFHLGVEDADFCMRMKQHGYTCWYAHQAELWHKVPVKIGRYKAGRTFETGRSNALFVRRFASPWQWVTFATLTLAAFPIAYLRERLRNNQAAAVAKFRGVLTGLREPLPKPPQPFG